jgi:queuine tRNA-ribosyltransferase
VKPATSVTLEVRRETDAGGRTGVLRTPHGEVATPAFMPVGTFGAVRGITPDQLEAAGVEMLLANSYHLALRPGVETITRLGGIHRFMGWTRPILTDSGGFQVFSLAPLVSVDERGAVFRSHLDGARMEMTPENSVDIQCRLEVDIGMVFDVVTPTPGNRDAAARAAERTRRWSRRAREARAADAFAAATTSIFGIMQGGLFPDLREANASALVELDFPGYAVGGLSVGESRDETMTTAMHAVGLLPREKPRYMMGMGTPADLVDLCGWGYDLFDCVIPTRNGRNGSAFTDTGTLSLRNSVHAEDERPLDPSCDCYACRRFSRGYLHHLAKRREMLAAVLASIHNIRYYQRLMTRIREALTENRYAEFRAAFHAARKQGEERE